MLKMVDGTGIIGLDMVCPLGGTVSPPQPPNFDKVEMEGVGSLTLPNSLKAPLERLELTGNSVQGENPAPDNPHEIKSAGRFDEASGKYLLDVKVTGKNLLSNKPTDWQIGKRISWSGYPEGAITIYPVIKNAVNVISLKPLTVYSIINNSGGIVINRIVERGLNKNGIKDHDVRSSKYTFVTNQNTMNVILQFEKVDGTELLSSDIESIKIMLVEGEVNEPTPYEPYTEQTLILTSDRPITKWDKLVEQGGQYGWLYQSEVKAYRGETAVSLYKSGFYFLLNNKKITKGEGYCSELKQDVPYEKNPCINFNMESNTYAYTLNTQAIYGSSVSEIKEYLKIHPLHLVYKTEATEFVPLSESEQTQLRNLHSYIGTTNIMVDSGEIPCGIKLTYRKEK